MRVRTDCPAKVDVISTFAVLLRPGEQGEEILLNLRPQYNCWEIPGGGIEASDKDAYAGAVREAVEELRVRKHKLLCCAMPTANFAVESYRVAGKYYPVALFRSEKWKINSTTHEESLGTVWFSIKEILAQTANEPIDGHHIMVPYQRHVLLPLIQAVISGQLPDKAPDWPPDPATGIEPDLGKAARRHNTADNPKISGSDPLTRAGQMLVTALDC